MLSAKFLAHFLISPKSGRGKIKHNWLQGFDPDPDPDRREGVGVGIGCKLQPVNF